MAQHEEIVLWLDRRWKNAIEKHLKGETLQEHLETLLDELCNQLPQREYERISREIYAEDAANREAEEAARTYAAYHVMENGQEWYYKTTPGEELLGTARMLRKYLKDTERSTGKFISLYSQAQPITPEEYRHLMHLRMENGATPHDAGRTEIHPQRQLCGHENGDASYAGKAAPVSRLGHYLW